MKPGKISIVIILAVISLFGCKKMDDQHNAVTDNALGKNIFQVISSNAKYSEFSKALVQGGFDKILSNSKIYTVFALNNDVMKTVDPTVLGDASKLQFFLANHITEQALPINSNVVSNRILMFGGKYNLLSSTSIESSTFLSSNTYASNGLIHEISAPLYSLDNCWEFLSKNAAAPVKNKNFLLSLFANFYDLSNAVITGVDPNTGANIYQKGTDSVYTNLFWRNVYNLNDESKQYTLFLVADAGWDAEKTALTPYFTTSTTDSTTFSTTYNMVRDYATNVAYPPSQLPDTVISKFGAKVPVKKANILSSYKTSNGYVYILSALPVAPAQRFTTRIIQAENYLASSVDRRSYTYFRDRYNDVLLQNYTDVMVLNHGVAMYNLRYDLTEMPNIKYKAYWVAVNDFQTASFTQKLGIGSPASALLPYTTVNGSATVVKSEVLLGEFQMPRYAPVLSLYLTAANVTTNGSNSLVCDYIKLVPSL